MSDKKNNDPQSDHDAGLAADATLDLTIVKNDADAGGAARNTALATIAGGTSTGGTSTGGSVIVDFQIVSGNAIFTETGTQTVSKSTNPLMMASADFTDVVGETGAVSATVRSRPALTRQADYMFHAAAGMGSLDMVPAKSGAAADGASANMVRAVLRDAAGKPEPDRMLVITITAGTATFRTGTRMAQLVTDENGAIAIDIVNNSGAKEKTAISCALADDAGLAADAAVFFLPPAEAAASDKLALTPPPQPAISNGNDLASVKARLTKASGEPIKDADLLFTLESKSPARFVDGSKRSLGTTDANGEAVKLILDDSGNNEFVPVSCSPVTQPEIVTSTTVEFRSGKTSGLELDLTVEKDKAAADGQDQNLVKATLTGPAQAISQADIRFTIAEPTLAHFANGETTVFRSTGSDGTVTVPVTDNAQIDQTVSVNAFLVSDSTVKDDVVLHFTTPAPGPTPAGYKLTLQPVKDNAVADGIDQNTVKAELVDSTAKPAIGETLVLNVSQNGTARFMPENNFVTAVITDSAGKALVALVDNAGKLDTVEVSGQMVRVPSVTAKTDVHFLASAPKRNRNIALFSPKGEALGNGEDFASVAATLTDADGKTVAGENLVFTLDKTVTARFQDGSQSRTIATGPQGNALVRVVDKTTVDKDVTVFCALEADPLVKNQIDVRFEEPPPSVVLPDMTIADNGGQGTVTNSAPRIVRTELKTKAGTAPAEYIVRTRIIVSTAGTFYIAAGGSIFPSRPTEDHYDTKITTIPGGTARVFNTIYFKGPPINTPAVANVRSELLLPGVPEVIEYTNSIAISFPVPPPPPPTTSPPPPPADRVEILVSQPSEPTPCNPFSFVRVNILIRINGILVPNAQYMASLNDNDGCSFFRGSSDPRRDQGSSSGYVGFTDQNGSAFADISRRRPGLVSCRVIFAGVIVETLPFSFI